MSITETAISRISAEMERKHLSVNTLAKQSGISQPTLHRILAMEAPLSLDRLEALCNSLNMSMTETLMPKKKVVK